MSNKEVDRLAIIQQIQSKQLSQLEAAKQLRLTTRQVRRLERKYEEEGPAGLVSKQRGQPSHNQLSETLKTAAVDLIKTSYPDFGPTFAHEKLSEQHDLTLSVESTRQLMLKEGIWIGKQRKASRAYQLRERRSSLGELIQADGSPHDWFEGRAPKCCLLVYIDDASSRLMYLFFVEAESTTAYFTATEKVHQTAWTPSGILFG